MNRRERRRRKRIEEKLREKHEKGPPTGLRLFNRTVSGTKLLKALGGAVLAFVSGYVLFHPHVSIEPGIVLTPGDPYSTQFDATNDSPLFDVKNLKPSCYTFLIETDHDVRQVGLPSLPLPTISVLGPREKTTTSCRPWVSGLGAGTGNVTKAYIIVEVSYKQDWWPFLMSQSFPLRGVIDSQKGVHWTHMTASELQAMSQQSSISK